MPSAAASRSALAPTTAAFLPPISANTGRGNAPSDIRRPISRPTSAEPVKATPSTPEPTSASPVLGPPWTSEITPSGTPASASSRATAPPDAGASSGGFSTTALPAARAAAVIPKASANGKLNGAMTPKTPYGRRTSTLRSSGESCPSGVSNPSAVSTCRQYVSIRSIASSTSAIASVRTLPTSRLTIAASSSLRSSIRRSVARKTATRSGCGRRRHSRCAPRAASTAWATSSLPSYARLATRSRRDGSSRANGLPAAMSRPPTRCESGSGSRSRASASAVSNARSSSGLRDPVV